MAFTDTINGLQYTTRTTNGRGFLPPMLRAMGHVLYLLGAVADENIEVSTEDAHQELTHALEHWNARVTTTAVSTGTVAIATQIGTALTEANAEYDEWNDEQRTENLRNLANRIIAYTCTLDRELIGITDSDPGASM